MSPVLRGRGRGREDRRRALAPLGLLFALFALFSQALAVAAPPMGDFSNARDAAQELGRLLGPGVVVCAQLDDSRAPATPHSCDDRCPICQAGAGGFALLVPAPVPTLSPAPVLAGALAFPPTARAPPRGPLLTALARGPPALI